MVNPVASLLILQAGARGNSFFFVKGSAGVCVGIRLFSSPRFSFTPPRHTYVLSIVRPPGRAQGQAARAVVVLSLSAFFLSFGKQIVRPVDKVSEPSVIMYNLHANRVRPCRSHS